MNLGTKRQLSRLTLQLLMLVVALVFVGTVVLVVCSGLQIDPFRERTSELLAAAFAGVIGVGFATLMLNVATNLSLMAEAKAIEARVEPSSRGLRPWLIGVTGACVAMTALVVVGAKLSERRFLAIVRKQAEELTTSNVELLRKAAAGVRSEKDLGAAVEILGFLQGQRRDVPDVSIVYASEFRGQRALHLLTSWNWSKEEPKAATPYYQCEQGFDCGYLDRFFSGQEVGVLQRMKNAEYQVYVPWSRDGARLMLRFGRTQRYGKVGSS